MFYFLQKDLRDFEYLMENMTMLPDIVSLNLNVLANGHAIGPSLFHVLRMCTSVRRLKLVTHISLDLEVKAETIVSLFIYYRLTKEVQNAICIFIFCHT